MPTASHVTETVVWTALPNGLYDNGDVRLSVYVSPRLSAQMSDNSLPTLSLFPDFVDWPSTIAGVTFTVTFGNANPVPATIEPVTALDSTGWKAVFGADSTAVEPWTLRDFSQTDTVSFDSARASDRIGSLYGQLGAASPTDHPTFKRDRQQWTTGDDALDQVINDLQFMGSSEGPLRDITKYHNRPAATISQPPKLPTIDFHQALGAVSGYPALLRRFGLVFDLRATAPAQRIIQSQIKVTVNPTWTSHFSPTTNVPAGTTTSVSLPTQATKTASVFRPTPLGSDYGNGMLNLADDSRFSVVGVDLDLAGDRLVALSRALLTILNPDQGETPYGASTAITTPALSSSGPTVVWSGFAGDLTAQAVKQADLQQQLATALATNGTLPTVYAEHIVRGHRLDVYTESDPAPAWRSLMGRFGTYKLGASDQFTATDEGVVTPSAATTATDDPQDSDALYVSERLARWNGWGLAAQFPGNVLGNDADGGPQATDNPGNPSVPPPAGGFALPQLSASFQAPNLGSATAPNPYPFPKLRFGDSYRFRARAADLAGNGEQVTSTDASTATESVTHYRYEPVPSPVLAHTAPLGPGEATQFLVLLDDQVNPPGTNGRWLFPPRTSPSMAEQHGMFDGSGTTPDPSQPPSPSAYSVITPRDRHLITDAPGVLFDATSGDVNPTPYIPGTQTSTPWLPDPLSIAAAISGLPGDPSAFPRRLLWPTTNWPDVNPVRLILAAGSTAGFAELAGSDSANPAIEITLPQAGVAVLRIANALTADALDQLGVWQWIRAELPSGLSTVPIQAERGAVWMLTPFTVLRMVHAVRLPLIAPRLSKPQAQRSHGSTSVNIFDHEFQVNENSTSALDFQATWTDPYDDPTNPASDPSNPAHASKTVSMPAFRLSVPDPNPIGPETQPLTISPPVDVFDFGPESAGGGATAGSTHHIGDTKHHTIYYTATGTSRFAELFQKTVTKSFTGTTPVAVSTPQLGINPLTVVMKLVDSDVELVRDKDFVVDADKGTIALTKAAGKKDYTVTYQPTVTLAGDPVPVEVLSSERPLAPHVARIRPAWSIEHAGASTVREGRAGMVRGGGYLRVYLDRPWFSSGAHEMLGIVTQTTSPDALTPIQQLPLTTTMGLDPISYTSSTKRPWPVIPTLFDKLGDVPVVTGRDSVYENPPRLRLAERPDSEDLYKIWPYPVSYDAVSKQWFADVHIVAGLTENGLVSPPPGYFVRLAMVRFQPYSLDGVEVSPLVLATIAQPVPDRLVTVIANAKDKSHKTVLVTVLGPGYAGFRGVDSVFGTTAMDSRNTNAPHRFDKFGQRESSTMAVDVEMHDTSTGLEGDLAWRSVTEPVRLPTTFSDTTLVEWGGEQQKAGLVHLPAALNGSKKMRLRISEVDYYPSEARLPARITTAQRRPFVTFIPLN